MATIKDVAKKAGVSVTTVSRVINDKPDVSQDTRRKVLNIIEEIGYRPNGVARGLVLNKTYTIGLVIPDISNPYFPEVARGVENKAKELGYSVIFCDTDNDKNQEKEAIELLINKRVDGIILSLSINNKQELFKLEQKKFPVIQIDREITDSSYPTVTIDNINSSFKATEHLIQLGHTKIGHITGDMETKTGQDRFKGFQKALEDYEIKKNKDWIKPGNYSKHSGFEQMKALLTERPRPSAIFAANDFMAIGAYEAVLDSELNIPDDISIIGHDDIEVASLVRPGLTTMAQPKYRLGQQAARLLIEQIEDKDISQINNVLLDSRLVLRQSTTTSH